MPEAMKRVQAVKAFRQASKSPPTQKLAAIPTRFHVENMPGTDYLLFPRVSSERRHFVPIGFIDPKTLTSDSALISTGATLFHFGILSSTMHNAWVRAVCGRLKSDFRYSAAIVYNNYPWPFTPAAEQAKASDAQVHKAQAAIEAAAQAVLDARAAHPGSSLADLYDPLTMPAGLLKAHQKLDAAVDKAYQLAGGPKTYAGDAARVAFLFSLYQRQTGLLAAAPAPRRRRGAASS